MSGSQIETGLTDILQAIVARTRVRNERERVDRAEAERVARTRTPFAFSAALRRPGVNVIAEIKSASPSAGSIVANPDVEAIAGEYRAGGAAAMSVVTEPEFFSGSRSWIARAKAATGLPVIM
jgi:indole-3-glycerol phosphate synthase